MSGDGEWMRSGEGDGGKGNEEWKLGMGGDEE